MKFQCKNLECPDIGKIYNIKITSYIINNQGEVICKESKCPVCKFDMEDITAFEGFGSGIKLSGTKNKNYYKQYKK